MALVIGRHRSGTRGAGEDGRSWDPGLPDVGFDDDNDPGRDGGDGYSDGRDDDINHMQLPRKRRRQYMTFFTVLTMIVATASCILVVLLIRGQSASDAANDARNQALEDKLTAIEASLGTLDQSVIVTGDTTAASNAQQYEELGATVDSLRTNLTDYRDNNDIQNEEIGDHLDRVIAQLDKIKEDMNTQQAQEDQQGDEIGSRLDSLTQSSEAGTSNLADELDIVHKDIVALIDATGDDQTGNYKELKGILTATDASLSDLVSDKFDETGSLISSSMSRLQGSIDGVSDDVSSGLSDVNKGVTEGLQSVGDDISGVNTSIAGVSTSLSGVSESLSKISGDMNGIDSRVDTVQNAIDDLADALDDYADDNNDMNDDLGKRIANVRTDITTFQTDMTDRVQQVREMVTALQTTIDERIKAEEQESSKEMYEALSTNLGLVQKAVADAQERVNAMDSKVDQILEAVNAEEPEPDPDPGPEPTPEPTPVAGEQGGQTPE